MRYYDIKRKCLFIFVLIGFFAFLFISVNQSNAGWSDEIWYSTPKTVEIGSNVTDPFYKNLKFSVSTNAGSKASQKTPAVFTWELNESGVYTFSSMHTWNEVVYSKYIDKNGKLAYKESLGSLKSYVYDYPSIKIDVTEPEIDFFPNGGTFINQTQITQVIVKDEHSGVNKKALRYGWSNSKTATPDNWSSFENNEILELDDVLGTFYLWVEAQDIAGNISVVSSESFYIDNKRVELNIQSTNGIKLENVIGYLGGNSTNTLNLMGLEIEDGNILLRDTNTGEVAVRESLESGMRVRMMPESEDVLEVLGIKLLTRESAENDVALVRIMYKLKRLGLFDDVNIAVGFVRENGVTTKEQIVPFKVWITHTDKDIN